MMSLITTNPPPRLLPPTQRHNFLVGLRFWDELWRYVPQQVQWGLFMQHSVTYKNLKGFHISSCPALTGRAQHDPGHVKLLLLCQPPPQEGVQSPPCILPWAAAKCIPNCCPILFVTWVGKKRDKLDNMVQHFSRIWRSYLNRDKTATLPDNSWWNTPPPPLHVAPQGETQSCKVIQLWALPTCSYGVFYLCN